MFETFEFTILDLSILIGYLLLSKFIPLWITRKKKSSSSGYFLGGKSFTWPMIGFSLFATNMSGSSFVGTRRSWLRRRNSGFIAMNGWRLSFWSFSSSSYYLFILNQACLPCRNSLSGDMTTGFAGSSL